MAAALQCVICGGKLVGKPGSIFECDSCGMEYSTEWAREKIQEIKGTVKVEGAVEVTGKVQLDGPVKVEGGINIENLLRRGHLALEHEKWRDADSFFDNALNYDAQCGEAYLGKLMAQLKVSQRTDLANRCEPINCWINYGMAIRFGSDALKAELAGYTSQIEKTQKNRREYLTKRRAEHTPFCGIIYSGVSHVVGVKTNGTVVAAGNNNNLQCNVSGWEDIVAVCAGRYHTAGLKTDGTVVATKIPFYNGSHEQINFSQCDVSAWKDIVAISAGELHTVGLKSDGTVVAVGSNEYDQCEVGGWTDIVAVSAGHIHTVGLKADGTVVATGSNSYGQCNVSSWKEIVAISAGSCHTVGLESDGTVVAVGEDPLLHFQCEGCYVSGWKDIVAISAGTNLTVGLKSDGTVVTTDSKYNVSVWSDIVAISGTIGLKSDGTMITMAGQNDVSDWKLFQNWETIKEEQVDARKQRTELRKAKQRGELEWKKNKLETELSSFRSLFNGKRRKEIENKLSEINDEMEKLN